jgi:hypothetical protein
MIMAMSVTTITIAHNIATDFGYMEALVLIGHTGGRELPCPPHNIQSQELKSSSFSAPVHIVVYFAIVLAGMGNPKAALESKAVAAVVLIRPTVGRESSCPPHNICSQLHGSVPTPTRMSYPLIRPVGWVGSVFPIQP